MAASKSNLTVDQLRELLHYTPETGVLVWLVGRMGGAIAGTEAGGIERNGYRRLMVCGVPYKAHRVAWALHHGAWPTSYIDHIDGVKTNNRIANLRDVSHGENIQNLKRARSDNRSGSSVQGVSWDARRGKFKADAKLDGRTVFIGRFATMAEAESAAIAYRRANYSGFTL